MAALVAAILVMSLQQATVQAHQAVDPKILKMIKKAPAGTPSCYINGDKTQPTPECIEKGRKLFEQETFDGNGRTCASCHPATNHFTIDVPYINSLPKNDKLFVNEQVKALRELETPLLRKYGLICENLDGFADDATGQSCVLRSVIATEGLKFTTSPDPYVANGTDVTPTKDINEVVTPGIVTPARPLFPLAGALGWGGDGSPGDGSLRNFAIGAVIQHFPKSLLRTPNIDFVLPTEDELDAMEAFQLSLGRQQEMNLSPDPFAGNGRFNCTTYDGSVANRNACVTNSTTIPTVAFQLKTMAQLKQWNIDRGRNIKGTLITFNDPLVERGQIVFFGGFPSRPVGTGSTESSSDLRSCSGCHIQAGASSASAPNSPKAGNRPRATGASEDPRSPLCYPEAWGVIFNGDGGFGQGAGGFPTQTNKCDISVPTTFTPIESCFKTFTTTTTPPLSNPSVILALGNSVLADVGNKFTMSRKDLCNKTASVPDEQVYFTGTSFFSTPSVIEAASTIPLFHNDIVDTVENAVSFYASDIFNNSVSGAGNRMVLNGFEDPDLTKLNIPRDVGAFLRAINALNNLNITIAYIDSAIQAANQPAVKARNAMLAVANVTDVTAVLTPGGPDTANHLGYEGTYDLFNPTVLSRISTIRETLTQLGTTDAAYRKLTLDQLKNAHNQVVAACQAMLTDDAQAACPASL